MPGGLPRGMLKLRFDWYIKLSSKHFMVEDLGSLGLRLNPHESFLVNTRLQYTNSDLYVSLRFCNKDSWF